MALSGMETLTRPTFLEASPYRARASRLEASPYRARASRLEASPYSLRLRAIALALRGGCALSRLRFAEAARYRACASRGGSPLPQGEGYSSMGRASPMR